MGLPPAALNWGSSSVVTTGPLLGKMEKSATVSTKKRRFVCHSRRCRILPGVTAAIRSRQSRVPPRSRAWFRSGPPPQYRQCGRQISAAFLATLDNSSSNISLEHCQLVCLHEGRLDGLVGHVRGWILDNGQHQLVLKGSVFLRHIILAPNYSEGVLTLSSKWHGEHRLPAVCDTFHMKLPVVNDTGSH